MENHPVTGQPTAPDIAMRQQQRQPFDDQYASRNAGDRHGPTVRSTQRPRQRQFGAECLISFVFAQRPATDRVQSAKPNTGVRPAAAIYCKFSKIPVATQPLRDATAAFDRQRAGFDIGFAAESPYLCNRMDPLNVKPKIITL